MDAVELVRPAVPTQAAQPAKSSARPAPVCHSDFAHLSLDALRSYRKALGAEESKVSYWRRIIQARLDVQREGRAGSLDRDHLKPVLTDERVSSGRNVLVEVLDHDDIPPLPNLAALWERQVEPGDAAAAEALDADLSEAEEQLSAYRTALHVRIGDATTELIARYREQPALALTALPLQPQRRVV